MSAEPDLQVISKGLSPEQSERTAQAIFGILNCLDKKEGLDFRRLHRIILTNDLGAELAELSQYSPSGNTLTHTDEEYAQAVAQVVPLKHDDGFEFVLVVNANYASLLILDEGGNQDTPFPDSSHFALHSFHHEFIHVHDFNKKLDALHSGMLRTAYSGKDQYIGPLADACWSEYYANFMSSSTATALAVDGMTESLTEALKSTKQRVDASILAYRRHADLVRLLEEFGRHGGYLAKTAAYTLGYVAGLGVPLSELSTTAAEALAGSYFERTWDAMHGALLDMHEKYPDRWSDLSIYDALSEALHQYYSDMGLVLSNTANGGCHLKVPFRPETTPRISSALFSPK